MTIEARVFLTGLATRIEQNRRAARALTDGRSEAQLMWRPGPERWGIADCFEHLIATGEAYHPRIAVACATGPAPPDPAVYSPRLFGRWFIRTSGPEGRIRLRARGPFVPPPSTPDSPRRFIIQQDELLVLVEQAAEVDLQRARVRSPLSRLLILTLGEALEMLVAHQARHIRQAERVKEGGGFPGGAAAGGSEACPPE